MALKNKKKVEFRHKLFTGNMYELNFYVEDALNKPELAGFEIERVVLVNAPRKEAYSLDDKVTLLYVLSKRNEGGFVGPVEEEPVKEVETEKEPKKKKDA